MTPALDRLLQIYRQFRNASELAEIASRNFSRHLAALDLNEEVVAWAATATERNTLSLDERQLAVWIRARILEDAKALLREGEHAHGDTVG